MASGQTDRAEFIGPSYKDKGPVNKTNLTGILYSHQTLTAFHSYQQLTLDIQQPTWLSHGAEI